MDTCHQVEGVVGQPGLVRYCASTKKDSWFCKERLVSIDPGQRCLSYEVLENDAGFGYYVATIRVIDDEEGGCCRIEWSFVADPLIGWTVDGLREYVGSCLDHMACKIQEAVLCSCDEEN
ncbi:hypothetical protein LINPERHAP1_LOCUS16702 [Linum perenne]